LELTQLSAAELSHLLASRQVSAVEVTQAHLKRIGELDSGVRAFITVTPDIALQQAARAQDRIDRGEAHPLTGIPIAVKDNISTEGILTTCASKILDNYVPPFDATVVARLKEVDAVILGKTNLDEFGMGASTENSAFFPTRNPIDLERSPGGSSGGSAAAVAAGMAPLALGSDTGGSVRQPAALCGVYGFKPTYGRISRYGLVAFASSLDQVGVIGRSVEDVQQTVNLISGHDFRENTSLPLPPIRIEGPKDEPVTIGLPKQFFAEALHPGVRDCIEQRVEELRGRGYTFKELDLPSIEYGVTTYYIIAPSEASSNLARFDGIRYGPQISGDNHIDMVAKTRGQLFGHEVKSRIMMGTYALSAGYYDAYYLKAQQVRAMMTAEFDKAFQEVDYIMGPTSPVPAFRLGELKEDPLALKLLDYCTIPASLTGCPAISTPCGFTDGLPVGLQIMSARETDKSLLAFARCVEKNTV
jgi:aspartyl-tRNA(Asn)/glutamyl-tRNA(Gln) amidotransferase subunit A